MSRVPPRVLLIMAEHWPRALLRASLRERGYDAVGAPDCAEALVYPAEEEGRGPVKLMVLDSHVLRSEARDAFRRLRREHGDPPVVLLVPEEAEPPPGAWAEVLTARASVADIVAAVERVLPGQPA